MKVMRGQLATDNNESRRSNGRQCHVGEKRREEKKQMTTTREGETIEDGNNRRSRKIHQHGVMTMNNRGSRVKNEGIRFFNPQ